MGTSGHRRSASRLALSLRRQTGPRRRRKRKNLSEALPARSRPSTGFEVADAGIRLQRAFAIADFGPPPGRRAQNKNGIANDSQYVPRAPQDGGPQRSGKFAQHAPNP